MGILNNVMAGVGRGLEQAGASGVMIGKEMLAQEAQKRRDATLEKYRSQAAGKEREFRTSERKGGQEFTASERDAGQIFRSQERQSGEAYRTGERKAGETFKSGEAGKDRELKGRELKLRESILSVSQAAEGRLQVGANLDNEIKTIAVENANTIKTLREEFANEDTTAERKAAINDTLHVLTGKDKNKFLPVPLKDDMGNVTGYKIFDTIRGVWVEGGAAGGTQQIRYGADGKAYVRGPDGNPIPYVPGEQAGGAQAKGVVNRRVVGGQSGSHAPEDATRATPKDSSAGYFEKQKVLEQKRAALKDPAVTDVAKARIRLELVELEGGMDGPNDAPLSMRRG